MDNEEVEAKGETLTRPMNEATKNKEIYLQDIEEETGSWIVTTYLNTSSNWTKTWLGWPLNLAGMTSSRETQKFIFLYKFWGLFPRITMGGLPQLPYTVMTYRM